MNIRSGYLCKFIAVLLLVLFADLSLQQTWAKSASRAPSSVENEDEVVENSVDSVDETEPNKFGVQDIITKAALPKKYKQSFEDAFIEIITEGDSEMVDIGQPLTREFGSAYVARERINRCSRFIRPDGNFGEWGQLIDTSLTQYSELHTVLVSSRAASAEGMRSVCPRFASLSGAQKREFWVWVMTSLALFESTCGYDTSNASNRDAVGIYQLNKDISDRSPRALIGNRRCGTLTAVEIARPHENILCTLDFIRDGFSGRMPHAPAGLVTEAQQFQKLRRENTALVRLIKKFQLCQPARIRPST